MQRNQQSGPLAILGHQQTLLNNFPDLNPDPKTGEELPVTRGSDLIKDQGDIRDGDKYHLLFSLSEKYRIGDYRIYFGLVFKSLETILMIGAIRNSLLQGLFRKYYGVECKHPSVYSKDIVETRDGLIQGYLRCLLCVSETL